MRPAPQGESRLVRHDGIRRRRSPAAQLERDHRHRGLLPVPVDDREPQFQPGQEPVPERQRGKVADRHLHRHRHQHLAAERSDCRGLSDLHDEHRLVRLPPPFREQQAAQGLHVDLGAAREIDVAGARAHPKARPADFDPKLVRPVVAPVLGNETEPVVVRHVVTRPAQRAQIRAGHVRPATRAVRQVPQVLPAEHVRPGLLVHRVERVAQHVRRVDQVVEDARLGTEPQALPRQPERPDRPVAGQEQQDLAALRHVERPHRRTDRRDRELEVARQTLSPRLGRRPRQIHRGEGQVGRHGSQVLLETGARRRPHSRSVGDALLVDQSRGTQHAAERTAAFQPLERGAGPPPVGRERAQDLQPAAALDDHRHLIAKAQARQLALEPANHRPPEHRVGVIVVDEQEVVRRHRVAVADRRRRLSLPRLDRPVLQDLGEVVHRHFHAVHEDAEVVRLETVDAVPRPILDHDLHVDHPDVDLLAEEQVAGRRRVGPGRGAGPGRRVGLSRRGRRVPGRPDRKKAGEQTTSHGPHSTD